MSKGNNEIIVPYDLGYYIAIRDEPQLPNMDDDAQIDFVAPYEQMVLNVCEYHTRQKLSHLKKRVDKIPTKNIDMQVAHCYPGYRGSKEFIPKKIVMQIIEELE